jgi:hypothetical protein
MDMENHDLLQSILPHCDLSALLLLRAVGPMQSLAVDSPPPVSAWTLVPASFHVERISKHCWLTLAAANQRICSICQGSYRGQFDADFGTFAHPDCRRVLIRNTYYATGVTAGLPCAVLTGYSRWSGAYEYNAIWWEPHWCVPRHHTFLGQRQDNHEVETMRCANRDRVRTLLSAREAELEAASHTPEAIAANERRGRKRDDLTRRQLESRNARVSQVHHLVGSEQVRRLLQAPSVGVMKEFQTRWLELSALTLKTAASEVVWTKLTAFAFEAWGELQSRESMSIEDSLSSLAMASNYVPRNCK